MKRHSDYSARLEFYFTSDIGFVSPQTMKPTKFCWSCGDTLVARQPDGRFACFYCFTPIQVEMALPVAREQAEAGK